MREEKKRSPEHRRAHGEMILEMARGRSKIGPGLVAFVEARPAETFVGVLIVLGEIETGLDQRRACKSVVANAIATHPGIEKRKRAQEKKKKPALRFARAMRGRCAEILPIHERGSPPNNFSILAATTIRQHLDAGTNLPKPWKEPGHQSICGGIIAQPASSGSVMAITRAETSNPVEIFELVLIYGTYG